MTALLWRSDGRQKTVSKVCTSALMTRSGRGAESCGSRPFASVPTGDEARKIATVQTSALRPRVKVWNWRNSVETRGFAPFARKQTSPSRGAVVIVDQPGLEAMARECYQDIKADFDALHPD